MNTYMDISRRTWIAAIKLAMVISVVAALAAVVVSRAGQVPDVAIVAVVAVVAFAASWVQTGRVRNTAVPLPARSPMHAR